MSWSSPERLGPAAGIVMQYGAPARISAALLFVVAVAALLLVGTRHHGAGSGAPKVFLVVASLALGAATVEVFGVAHRLRPDGIERVMPWRPRAVIRWAEVTSLEWVEATHWFELRARSGERVRVHRQLTGMVTFARAVLEGVPAEVIDARPGLRQRLEQLARGATPPDEPDQEAWRGG
jgi:hypothetical protein